MGIGLNINRIFFLLLLSILASCHSSKESIYQSKKDFMFAYKASVFYGCLNSATNNNFSKFSQNNNDLGLAPIVAIIYHAETKEATKLGEEYSKKIQPSTYGDYKGKSPIYSSCAYYSFYSQEVDSVAMALYKKMKKAKSEYDYEN